MVPDINIWAVLLATLSSMLVGALWYSKALFGRRWLELAKVDETRMQSSAVGAYLLVLYAFQRAPAGRVSTLRESSVLIGILLSGERPSSAVWVGAVLVLMGALLAAG